MKPERITPFWWFNRREAMEYEVSECVAAMLRDGPMDTLEFASELAVIVKMASSHFFPRSYTLGKVRWHD